MLVIPLIKIMSLNQKIIMQHDQESFKEDLRNWAVTHLVPNSTISDLLSILRKQHPYLPKDPRTLLKTKVNDAVVNKCGGQYYHFGMSSALSQQLETHSSSESLRDQFYVKIQINIDGLPSFKSASDQFWSILGMIANLELKKTRCNWSVSWDSKTR